MSDTASILILTRELPQFLLTKSVPPDAHGARRVGPVRQLIGQPGSCHLPSMDYRCPQPASVVPRAHPVGLPHTVLPHAPIKGQEVVSLAPSSLEIARGGSELW